MLGWGMDYPDATNFYDFHFTGGVPRFGKEWDDVITEIKAAAQIADPAERQNHYDKVAALIKEHVPMIPVAHGAAADVFSKSVGNVKIGALNENFQDMTTDDGQLVWIQGAEPISLWCGDETDGETLRACLQLYNSLLGYEFGGTKAVPASLSPGMSTTTRPSGRSICVRALSSAMALTSMRMMWLPPTPPSGMRQARTIRATQARLNTLSVSSVSS